ncbi:MAG: ABC transporter ATP-binding protein [Proteobacteria bacterium]|nr:ABC transporter ATP-binding protein [Pseudomonadota bacterium]
MVEWAGRRSVRAWRRLDRPDDDLRLQFVFRCAPPVRHGRGKLNPVANVDSALEVIDLAKDYPGTGHGTGRGIRPISFSLKTGTFFTLLGPSGCGKTTTLRCVAGLEQPDEGMVRLGRDVLFDARHGTNVALNRRNIGMVFQSYAIWPHMTVFENVAFPLRVSRDRTYGAAEVERLVGGALETVNLAGFQGRSPTQLSGGQQQRVALARAIVRSPRLLLLDEPLSNLDAKLRDEMRNELKRLQQQIGVTTIYVTHDQSEALEMSDMIAVINQGQLMQIGSPREIYFRPRDAFVAGFMGSTNLLTGTIAGSVPENGVATVKLTGGQVVKCQFPNPTSSVKPIAISVRPEAIDLRQTNAPPRDGWNRLIGTVVSAGFLGQTNRYNVRVGDLHLQSRTGPETNFTSGESVAVEFSVMNAIGLATADGKVGTDGPAQRIEPGNNSK